jgi:uncharacterized protein DUF2840
MPHSSDCRTVLRKLLGSAIALRRSTCMSDLTHIELLWLEKRIENWIGFGHHAQEQIFDKRRRILSFAPGSIFAFVGCQMHVPTLKPGDVVIIDNLGGPEGESWLDVPSVRPAPNASFCAQT